jgi:hypothetical protein
VKQASRNWSVALALLLAGCCGQGILIDPVGASGSTGSSMMGSSGGGASSGSGGTTTGGCVTSSGMSCASSSDCCGASPCCEAGTSECEPIPQSPTAYCLCSGTSECSFYPESVECVPHFLFSSGTIDGPYICVGNSGARGDGCRGASCFFSKQFCATDQAGNEFCSDACTSDLSCGNPGVACCNAACQDGGRCCGLCPDAG